MPSHRHVARMTLILLAALSPPAAATAQGWRKEQVREVSLEFDAPGGLERIPMRLGSDGGILRARLQPKDKDDLIDGRLAWVCEVLEFGDEPEPEPPTTAGGDSEDPEEAARRQLVAQLRGQASRQPKTFLEWIKPTTGPLGAGKNTTELHIDVEGAVKTGRGDRLSYRHWVWRLENGSSTMYGEAAVYEHDGHEVALAIRMPLEDKRQSKPSPKWRSMINKMIRSGSALEAEDDGDDEDRQRDRHADTPARQAALAAAKENIKGLKGWDYFTTPHYIVVFSWDYQTNNARGISRKQAKFYSSRLEKMRDLYVEHYPLDESGLRAVLPDPTAIPSASGPVTGEPTSPATDEPMADGEPDEEAANVAPPAYPVFRLCATYDQFRKYGQSPRGVVGWFSPVSKELVVFLGGDEMMGDGATETVTYHEGWHQFADLYFNHPDRPKREPLHRWFDEGHGDYFGSFSLRGGSWRYEGSQMRHDSVVQMVDKGDYVPFKDIVNWPRQKFYSGRAAYYYAQAWSMIDFLRRGDKLGRHWQERYGTILTDYQNVMLVHGDSKLAVATAYRDFSDADWRALETAWKEWVQSRHFRGGR